MKKKKVIIPKNYLEKVPAHPVALTWTVSDDGKVTLQVQNKGWANWIAQRLFGRPKVSYVHLDELGNFIWPKIDGQKNLIALGELVEAEFGEKAHPLYERLARYFQILDSYGFIVWKQ